MGEGIKFPHCPFNLYIYSKKLEGHKTKENLVKDILISYFRTQFNVNGAFSSTYIK